MFQVPQGRIARVRDTAQHAVPAAVDLVCPSCRRDVTFSLPQWTNHNLRGLPVQGRCPRCAESTTFIRLGGKARGEMRLYVDAEPVEREQLNGLEAIPAEKFPPKLKKTYASALRALGNDDPGAVAVHCRKVLEGITSQLLASEPSPPKVLAQRLEILAKEHSSSLAQPLLDLSKSLKDGGNLGAHFDDEEDTSRDDAEHMVELLDILITYLFVLPEQVRRFRAEVLGEESDDA